MYFRSRLVKSRQISTFTSGLRLQRVVRRRRRFTLVPHWGSPRQTKSKLVPPTDSKTNYIPPPYSSFPACLHVLRHLVRYRQRSPMSSSGPRSTLKRRNYNYDVSSFPSSPLSLWSRRGYFLCGSLVVHWNTYTDPVLSQDPRSLTPLSTPIRPRDTKSVVYTRVLRCVSYTRTLSFW